MKADVFPATIPPKLDIPSWVPDAVAQHVSAEYAAAVDPVYETALRESDWFEPGWFEPDFKHHVPREYLYELISNDVVLRELIADLVRDKLAEITKRYRPLVCDRRMERVWWELSRQRRSGVFLHPACVSSGANAQERQDAAMLELFNVAFECQGGSGATTTQHQAEQQRNCYLAKADELWNEAITMLLQPSLLSGRGDVSDNKRLKRYQKLQAAAQVYRDYANEVYTTTCATALERKHDGRGRRVALTIGDKFRALFGKPMYGLTTTIMSVVLGRKIKLRTVRQWLLPKT